MCRYESETALCGHPQYLKLFPCNRKSEASAYHTVRHIVFLGSTQECNSCIKGWTGDLLSPLLQGHPRDIEFFAFGACLQPYDLPMLWTYDGRQARSRDGTNIVCPLPEAFLGRGRDRLGRGTLHTYILRLSGIHRPSPWNRLIGCPWAVPHFEVRNSRVLDIRGDQVQQPLPRGRNAPLSNVRLPHEAWIRRNRLTKELANGAVGSKLSTQPWDQGSYEPLIGTLASTKAGVRSLDDQAMATAEYYRSLPLIVHSKGPFRRNVGPVRRRVPSEADLQGGLSSNMALTIWRGYEQ